MAKYEKVSSGFRTLCCQKIKLKAAIKFVQGIAKGGKPISDREYIQEPIHSSSEVIFDGLPNKDTIISRIKDISARTVEKFITDMCEKSKAPANSRIEWLYNHQNV